MLKIQTGPSIWYGPDILERESEWLFHLTNEELEELKVAADLLVDSSPDENYLNLEFLENMAQFHLPTIQAKAKEFIEQLHNGLGFFVWRGMPVETWSRKRLAAAFALIGKCMGNLRQQNSLGHVIGHVKDLGLSGADPNVRIYQTHDRQTFHCDWSDVVGLLCLRIAKSGGLSSLVSAGTVFNEMLQTRPDLLAELMKPQPMDKRGEVPQGAPGFYNVPVYSDYEGFLTVMYQRPYIDSSQRFPEAPRLTPIGIQALDMFDSLLNDPKLNFTMKLLPGDMQFVQNHMMLHDRTEFEDWEDVDKRRHLLRLWLATPGGRPLPPCFAERYGSVEVGNRGGVNVAGVTSVAPLDG